MQLGFWEFGHLCNWASGLLGIWASGLLGIWASGHLSVHKSRTTLYTPQQIAESKRRLGIKSEEIRSGSLSDRLIGQHGNVITNNCIYESALVACDGKVKVTAKDLLMSREIWALNRRIALLNVCSNLSVERLNSRLRLILHYNRRRLGRKRVEALVVLKAAPRNLRNLALTNAAKNGNLTEQTNAGKVSDRMKELMRLVE